MGSLFTAIEHIAPTKEGDEIEISFQERSPLLIEAMEAPAIRKKGAGGGTGPFFMTTSSATGMQANPNYYLGPPAIQQIEIARYDSVRSAWADMLRERVDMLYDVGLDALDSLEGSSNIAVYRFIRKFQYIIAFNSAARVLQPPEIRRALNASIDRDHLVKEALHGHGVASTGPLWPQHWAVGRGTLRPAFDPEAAAAAFGAASTESRGQPTIRFTCLVPADAVYGRIALEVKRQLSQVGVDMALQEVSLEQLDHAISGRNFEAALVEGLSGPTLYRPYQLWHSGGVFNPGGLGNKSSDRALDALKNAKSDDDYRVAALGVQQAFLNDPPAIFLAWTERARAVSKRFVVPSVESGRDVLSTIRLWKPPTGDLRASRN